MKPALSLYCKGHEQWFKQFITNFGGSLLCCEECLKATGAEVVHTRLWSEVTIRVRPTREGEAA